MLTYTFCSIESVMSKLQKLYILDTLVANRR